MEKEKPIGKYKLETGGYVDVKPEHMTQIYSNNLVNKDHPIVVLRGEVDILMSEIMKVQLKCEEKGYHKLTEDLQSICYFLSKLQQAEVMNTPLEEDIKIIGMTEDEVRTLSHNPKKYFGIDFLWDIDYKIGEFVVYLNSLRALVRKVELASYRAFKDEYGQVKRVDLMRGYNRTSSVLYVMMYRFLTGVYDNKEK